MGATGPHFSEKELACPCCGVNGMQQEAVDLAENVRSLAEDHFGMGRVVMKVSSGYRCAGHNATIGGAPASQHVQGLALDFFMDILQDRGKNKQEPNQVSSTVVEGIARKAKLLGGIGLNRHNNMVHIDARPKYNGVVAQWCYSPTGKEQPYYQITPGAKA